VGIIGYGAIGQALAGFLKAMDCRLLVVKRTANREGVKVEPDFMGTLADLDYVLAESDFLVIAAPLTPQTKGLIGIEQLKLMKPTAFLVTIARGGIVPEKDLFTALKEWHIAGACIDVWEEAPDVTGKLGGYPSRVPFHTLDNVILSPHWAGHADYTLQRSFEFAVNNIRLWADGKQPIAIVDYERGY
jgi:phosphoglycerate dehydrogenase-like enzyme